MTIDEIQTYIQATNMKDPGHRYTIYTSDVNAIYELFTTNPLEAISLAFSYGKAKGFRLCRKGAR